MNISPAKVSAEVGPGIDPAVLDDVLDHAREVCAAHQIGALAVVGRRTTHPALADAVLTDVRATLRGRLVEIRAIRPTFEAALEQAFVQLSDLLNRSAVAANR
ncbi:hypothetical protein [Amycolatopsis benzoatilytica]|uniref:hypothetical protein n=1 Tax=Amycolatopsis benzoatilytica TaxID=346045 RepID=UPI0003809AF2|nr:hypothetical protein [Amycolatopsis benzoatilytica]